MDDEERKAYFEVLERSTKAMNRQADILDRQTDMLNRLADRIEAALKRWLQ